MRLKLIGVSVRWCATVFAYSRRSSVSGPRQKLCLWCEQLLVERRKQRVSCERVPLTKPVKLLHVKTAQRAQHPHLLVQLQGGHTHLAVSFLQQRGKPAILRVLTDMKHGAYKPFSVWTPRWLIFTLWIKLSWLSRCKMCVSPDSTLLWTLWTLLLSSRHGRSEHKDVLWKKDWVFFRLLPLKVKNITKIIK